MDGLQRFLGEYGHLDWNMGGVDVGGSGVLAGRSQSRVGLAAFYHDV